MNTSMTIAPPASQTVEGNAHTLNTQAWALRKTDVPTARRLAEESEAVCRNALHTASNTTALRRELATALLILSVCDTRNSDFAAALSRAQEAFHLFELAEDDTGQMRCLIAIARIHGSRSDFAKARELAGRGLELAEALHDIEGRGAAMNILGAVHWNTGDYTAAIQWYLRSLTELEASGSRREQGEVLNNLGLVYSTLGEYDKALEYSLSGLLLQKELGDRLGESNALLNIGNLYVYQGDIDRAREHFLHCLHIQKEIGYRDGQGHTLINLAELSLQSDEPAMAETYALSCIELARSIGDRRLESYALTSLGSVCQYRGQLDRALHLYKHSLELRRAIGYRAGEVASLLSASDLLMLMQRHDEAASYLRVALLLAEELGARRMLYDLHKRLAIVNEQLGDLATALHHYKLFHTIHSEVFSEQSVTRVKNLQFLFQMEQATKEAEIHRLRAVELAAANDEITRQKEQVEHQTQVISEHNATLRQQNELLARLNREKDELLGITVHGLKNPLAVIIMATSMLKKNADALPPGELEKNLDWIEQTAWRMEDIVLKLLRSSAAESGTIECNPDIIEMSSLVSRILRGYRDPAEAKNIRLEFERRGSDVSVFADMSMVRDIVDNLISNAVKFSPSFTTIRLWLEPSPAHEQPDTPCSFPMVRFTIQDEGPGIPDDDRARLFGRFERLSTKPTGGEHSTGLGLSIVKKLTELSGGQVWYESRPDSGATFIVELPAAHSHTDVQPGPDTAEH